jgi:hypothetical protein
VLPLAQNSLQTPQTLASKQTFDFINSIIADLLLILVSIGQFLYIRINLSRFYDHSLHLMKFVKIQ